MPTYRLCFISPLNSLSTKSVKFFMGGFRHAFFSTHRRPLSTFVALSRGLQRAYPMSKDLPDSIAQVARLETSTKVKPTRHGPGEKAAA